MSCQCGCGRLLHLFEIQPIKRENETIVVGWGWVNDGNGGVREMTPQEITEMDARFAPALRRSLVQIGTPAPAPADSGISRARLRPLRRDP